MSAPTPAQGSPPAAPPDKAADGAAVSAPPAAPGRAPARMFALSLGLAALMMVLDQASKLYLLWYTDLWLTKPWPIASFLTITAVWNPGISYGLFPQGSELGRGLLIGFNLLAALLLTIWMRRAGSWTESIGLALIVGGALGNAVDRNVHGAVFDFVLLHYAGFQWYVFNVADVGVVVGAALLLYEHFLVTSKAGVHADQPGGNGPAQS